MGYPYGANFCNNCDQIIPVLDGVTFEELFDVSPLLASRSGLNTSEETMEDIANKLSEVVSV